MSTPEQQQIDEIYAIFKMPFIKIIELPSNLPAEIAKVIKNKHIYSHTLDYTNFVKVMNALTPTEISQIHYLIHNYNNTFIDPKNTQMLLSILAMNVHMNYGNSTTGKPLRDTFKNELMNISLEKFKTRSDIKNNTEETLKQHIIYLQSLLDDIIIKLKASEKAAAEEAAEEASKAASKLQAEADHAAKRAKKNKAKNNNKKKSGVSELVKEESEKEPTTESRKSSEEKLEEKLEEEASRGPRWKTCVECGTTKTAMKKCARCFENAGTETFYCNEICQQKHWRNHRKDCPHCKIGGRGKKTKRKNNKKTRRRKTRRNRLIT
jgi:hypothetical protein